MADQTYTVKAAMGTGKTSQMYGVEYYVQFADTEGSYALWFKKEPQVGDKVDGTITGSKFKKAKKEWKPQEGGSSQDQSGTSRPPSRSYKDNSDGMRQGMCINNAANYVNALEFPKILTDREWADLVHSYATALYVLGDLQQSEEAKTVAGIFNDGN